MSPTIVAQVMGHDEAKNLWNAIQEYYGVHARSQENYNRQMCSEQGKVTPKWRIIYPP